jgi:hypothetical protein
MLGGSRGGYKGELFLLNNKKLKNDFLTKIKNKKTKIVIFKLIKSCFFFFFF